MRAMVTNIAMGGGQMQTTMSWGKLGALGIWVWRPFTFVESRCQANAGERL